MPSTVYDNYLQTEILGADPIKLVNILYRAAIDAISAARDHLRRGRIRERSLQITKALEILTELMHSLDHQRGGEISHSLEALYGYMQKRLIEANSKQVDPPLAEVERLLATLLEAWSSIRVSQPKTPEIPAEARFSAIGTDYESQIAR